MSPSNYVDRLRAIFLRPSAESRNPPTTLQTIRLRPVPTKADIACAEFKARVEKLRG